MIYIKTQNEEELLNAIYCWTSMGSDDDEYIEYYSNTPSLDVIGVIYKESGVILTLESGIEYNEMVSIDGYHANLILHGEDLPAALSSFVIDKPNNRTREFV